MDFLAILLPGALFVALLMFWRANSVLADLALPETSATWIAFAVAAYISGHLLHHLGGLFLDDRVYDGLYVKRYKRVCGDEWVLTQSKGLIREMLGLPPEEEMNYFAWATTYVRLNSAAAAAELERAGGESKFFRSLFIVSAIAIYPLFTVGGLPSLFAFALAVFSIWRYCDRRWAAGQQTYQFFIMLRLTKDDEANDE